MQHINSSHDFNIPRATLWSLLVDFGNIQRWWPVGKPVDIERVELEGEGIGMTRHIYNKGFESPVSERLDFMDPDNYRYTLSIVGEKPAGLLNYKATGSLIALDNGGCRLVYASEFQSTAGSEQEAESFLQASYALMYEGLEASCT
jgi:hypothetical protein